MLYAVVDIETTGNGYKGQKITEISALIFDGKKIVDEFTSLVNPEQNIPTFITNLTGITNAMVRNAPKFYEVAKKIDPSNLYEDEMFQRYCRAKSKQRLGEMITTFDYVLPGDVKINYTNLVTKADTEMAAVLEAIKGENSAGWMYTMRF